MSKKLKNRRYTRDPGIPGCRLSAAWACRVVCSCSVHDGCPSYRALAGRVIGTGADAALHASWPRGAMPAAGQAAAGSGGRGATESMPGMPTTWVHVYTLG